MRLSKKIKLVQIKEFLKRLPWLAAERAFLAFLILFFLSLIIGGVLFYKYKVLALEREPVIQSEAARFREDLYQGILEKWQKRDERFEAASSKEYPDPFQP